MTNRIHNICLSGLFLMGLCVPVGKQWISPAPSRIETTEHRTPAPFPSIETKTFGPVILLHKRTVKQFPRQFDAWFNDHLGGRELLLTAFHRAKNSGWVSEAAIMPALGENARSTAIVGRNGWLYYAGEQVIDDYRCTKPFTQSELDVWKQVLEQRQRWLAERGIRYLLVIVPNKHTIYPEHLPRQFNRVRKASRLDQLNGMISETTRLQTVELRNVLTTHKNNYPTYYQTDSHWNNYGAFLASQQILKSLNLSEIKVGSEADYKITQVERPGQYLATMIAGNQQFSDQKISLAPKFPRHATVKNLQRPGVGLKNRLAENPHAPLERAVILHDSFMPAMEPFLNEQWQHLRYIWTDDFPAAEIEKEHPQVVIQEFVERKLMSLKPVNPAIMNSLSTPREKPAQLANQVRQPVRKLQ